MKLLLIGSGGREHALARKLSLNENVEKIFCAPGNGGTYFENKCENINITNNDELLQFTKENKIDLTVVGPEQPLIEGIVDLFKANGQRIFGPSKKAAMLEGSKSFSKIFMDKYNVKTAKYDVFSDYETAKIYLEKQEFPVVIKADGLAAGKGVYICKSLDEGINALKEIMIADIFNGAGKKVVIEEFLDGVEASILSITDGKSIIPFISAKDHKQIFDGGIGPNTGGMGVICPNSYVTKGVESEFIKEIMNPTIEGIKRENLDFIGIIFFGIMITKKGVYLLEYNVRMGDPETQSVLELMESDLVELIENALAHKLIDSDIKWKKGFSCNVVLASGGYPGKYKTGYEIKINKDVNSNIYFAGAKEKYNNLYTSGGRVASVSGFGKTKEEAIMQAYRNTKNVEFIDKYNRKDIGK